MELVIWIPFFLAVFLLIVEASVFYWRYTTMWDVTRDAARDLSVGAFSDCASGPTTACVSQVQAFVTKLLGPGFTASLNIEGNWDERVSVQTPLGNLTIIGILNLAMNPSTPIVAEVRMRDEPV